jgi:hypothetical protein
MADNVTCAECGFLVVAYWDGGRVAEGVLPPDPASPEERSAFYLRKGGLNQFHPANGQVVCFRGVDLRAEKEAPPPGVEPRWMIWNWEDVINSKRSCRFLQEWVRGLSLQWHIDRHLALEDRQTDRRFTLSVAFVSAVLGAVLGAALGAVITVALTG